MCARASRWGLEEAMIVYKNGGRRARSGTNKTNDDNDDETEKEENKI
jgi:hypothetical protein